MSEGTINKVIIIGNGFDLSHGYETSYKDFLKNLFIKHFNKEGNGFFEIQIIDPQSKYRVSPPTFYKDFIQNYDEFQNVTTTTVKFKNIFLKKLYRQLTLNNNWVDIEKEYFSELYKSDPKAAQKLNQEFQQIKNELVIYLSEIQKVKQPYNKLYLDLFVEDDFGGEILFINFNYTETLEIYSSLIQQRFFTKNKIIYIHKKISDANSKIIFGYGDEEDMRYKELRNKDENIYHENIKSVEYNSDYKKIISFLKNPFNVQIVGHSCGISDRTLLNKILTNSNAESIELMYHKNENNYKDLKINMIKIFMDNDNHKEKLVPIEGTRMIPQLK